ncbi:MAG TPA: hypothetical protein VK167_11960 [Flavipsychrobacter sp.]|nr:hypothetical protein [Flavipsychrobacter sp.]
MKPILTTIFVALLTITCFAQPIGADCNPKLNDAEAALCNKLFSNTGYDFKGKTVMYITNIGEDKTYSSGYLPATKTDFFRQTNQATDTLIKYHLAILNAEQKLVTPDIDVVIYFMTSGFNRSFKGEWVDKSIKRFKTIKINFPDNIALAGKDTSENISIEDAKFLNSIFRHERNSFDFTNKKVAITSKHYINYVLIHKYDYIRYLKTHFKTHFSYPAEWLYVLNSAERATTGYDAVIVERETYIDYEKILKLLEANKPTTNIK